MTKPLHAGRAAHAGVASARLAASGFTAARDVLDHVPGFLQAYSYGGRIDLESPVTAGREWQICSGNRISIKKYPMCFCTHRAIDGVFDLLQKYSIDVDDVDRIEVTISRRNLAILRNHAPLTGLEAKFSIEFAVVAPLIARRAGLSELTDVFVLRSDVQAMMKRVVVQPDDRDNPDRPGYAIHDRVVLVTRSGGALDSGPIAHVRGDHDSPLQRWELWSKFEDCVRGYGGTIDAAALFATLMNLADLQHAQGLISVLAAAREVVPNPLSSGRSESGVGPR